MPSPQFSKIGVTTLVFSRGDLFPSRTPESYNQVWSESEAKVVRVATISPPVIWYALHFANLPLADYTALRNWPRHALILGRAYTFTYTDVNAIAFTVRWWHDTFEMPQTSYQRYSVDIMLRDETVAW